VLQQPDRVHVHLEAVGDAPDLDVLVEGPLVAVPGQDPEEALAATPSAALEKQRKRDEDMFINGFEAGWLISVEGNNAECSDYGYYEKGLKEALEAAKQLELEG
jgi:hypothetical protein